MMHSPVAELVSVPQEQAFDEEQDFGVAEFGNSMPTENLAITEDINAQNVANHQDSHRVIVSLVLEKNKLGSAIFDIEELTLTLFESWEETKTFSSSRFLKSSSNPQLVLAPSRTDPNLLTIFTEDGIQVLTLGPSAFALETARNKLAMIAYPADVVHEMTSEERVLRLSSLINIDSSCLMRAVAGLVAYMLQGRETNSGMNEYMVVNRIEYLNTADVMHIDSDSLRALQIFKSDYHPSAHGIGVTKEGLSLFGILDRTVSKSGKTLLRKWFLRPFRDIHYINDRLDCISFFIAPDAKELVDFLRAHLKKCFDLTRISARARTYTCSVTDWEHLYSTLREAITIKQAILNVATADISVIGDILAIPDSLEDLANIIGDTIDFKSSKEEKRIVLREGVNQYLDELKNLLSGLDSMLTSIGQEQILRRPNLPALKLVYIPQIGFHVAIPRDDSIPIEEQQHPASDLEYRFHTDTFIYFKDDCVRALDDEIGDLHHRIADIESQAARQLTDLVIKKVPVLLQVDEALARLDCILAFTIASIEYNYKRPIVTEENVIYIQAGRHPIQELCLPASSVFVPNDTAVAYGREGCIKIITGPNSSGKSVYLKQVALITYMAHIGCFVPAEAALIGLVDRIYTRVINNETILANRSSFLSDLTAVSIALNSATERSLVIIDEFGKGTDRLDGIALMKALVRHFVRLRERCPKVLICTHFHEMLDVADDRDVEHLTMDVLVQESAAASHVDSAIATPNTSFDSIVFLYKLVKKGAVSSSFGAYCAFLAGMPIEIIQRAMSIARRIQKGEPIEPIQTRQRNTDRLWQLFLEFDSKKKDPNQLKRLMDEIRAS